MSQVKLFQFKPAFNLPNGSAFCMKVENFLRMANIPYEVDKGDDFSILKSAPKGKLPYIVHNENIIADSEFIIEYLNKEFGVDLDKHLNDSQKAQALLIRRCFEEHLYWIAIYNRWVESENWPKTNEAFFGEMPAFLKLFVPGMLRKDMVKKLDAQGTGRHKPQEIYQKGLNDLRALSVILDENDYFMGKEPSSVDATAYAFLANLYWPDYISPLRNVITGFTNLVSYCERMQQRYYS